MVIECISENIRLQLMGLKEKKVFGYWSGENFELWNGCLGYEGMGDIEMVGFCHVDDAFYGCHAYGLTVRWLLQLRLVSWFEELQKSTGVATGSLHNAMPKFLGSLGIEFGFRQADSVHVVVPKEFERGMNGTKQQLLSTFVTVTNLKRNK
ncbi:hypothetical protein Tco_0935743 [Tanacetum coccineum]